MARHGTRIREGVKVNCLAFQEHLRPYLDGELGIDETIAASAHLGACPRCSILVERERRSRLLLRYQPAESAPAQLRGRIAARCRGEGREGHVRSWLAAFGAVAMTALTAVLMLLPPCAPSPLVSQFVGAHIAYARIEGPAEFASGDRTQLAAWFQERTGLRIAIPDYSPDGLRLVAGRLADMEEARTLGHISTWY